MAISDGKSKISIPRHRLRNGLEAGEPMFGCFSSLASSWTARIVASCGWDVSYDQTFGLIDSMLSLIVNTEITMIETCTIPSMLLLRKRSPLSSGSERWIMVSSSELLIVVHSEFLR